MAYEFLKKLFGTPKDGEQPKAMTYAELEAVRMIQEGECGEFSPQILDCFRLAKYELIEAMKEKFSYADGEMEEMDVMEEVDEPGSKDKGLPYVRNA